MNTSELLQRCKQLLNRLRFLCHYLGHVCRELFVFMCPMRCTWSIELSRFPGPHYS